MSEPDDDTDNMIDSSEAEPLTPVRMQFSAQESSKKEKEKKAQENKVIRLLEKNPLGMTLQEMAGGPRQVKKLKTLRPMLDEAIKLGMVMPVSQRAGNTVYRLVKNLGPR